MSLRASDLPQPVRREILNQVRQQVGELQYYQLVSQLGEDGVLNLILEKMPPASTPVRSAPSNSAAPPRAPSRVARWLREWVPFLLIFLFLSLVSGAIGAAIGYVSELIKPTSDNGAVHASGEGFGMGIAWLWIAGPPICAATRWLLWTVNNATDAAMGYSRSEEEKSKLDDAYYNLGLIVTLGILVLVGALGLLLKWWGVFS